MPWIYTLKLVLNYKYNTLTVANLNATIRNFIYGRFPVVSINNKFYICLKNNQTTTLILIL